MVEGVVKNTNLTGEVRPGNGVGNSRDDFVDICTNYKEFYEGMVRSAFSLFLLRQPTSVEMDSYTQSFIADSDLQKLQKALLKSKEYAGF